MDEEWRPVVGREGEYEVSNFGRVRNPKSRNRILKPYKQASGHLYLSLGRRDRHRFVHRLVYEAFVGAVPEGKVIRHLDGDPENNRPDNLAAGTQRDNAHDTYRYGGKMGPGRFTAKQVYAVRQRLSCGARQVDLAEELGVSVQTINNINTRRTFGYL